MRQGEKLTRPENKKPRDRRTATVIVAANGKAYAEILKTVKDKINLEEVRVQVKGVRSTKKGDLLLEVEKSSKEAEVLRSAIRKELEGIEVTVRGNSKHTMLHLRGLDGITKKSKVEEALKSAVGDLEGEIVVKFMKPAYGDCQNATIIAPAEVANILTRQGEVKIGWVNCKIQEREDISKYTKCWGLGHTSSRCKGPNREAMCLKCGSEDHKVKECRQDSCCLTCKKAGHRTSSMACPAY